MREPHTVRRESRIDHAACHQAGRYTALNAAPTGSVSPDRTGRFSGGAKALETDDDRQLEFSVKITHASGDSRSWCVKISTSERVFALRLRTESLPHSWAVSLIITPLRWRSSWERRSCRSGSSARCQISSPPCPSSSQCGSSTGWAGGSSYWCVWSFPRRRYLSAYRFWRRLMCLLASSGFLFF